MKPTNAFTIPEKSSVTSSDKRFFSAKVKKYNKGVVPIVLPGSSKHLPLKMMTRSKT